MPLTPPRNDPSDEIIAEDDADEESTDHVAQSAPKRADPSPRAVDGGHVTWNSLRNQDPNKHYVWVSLNKNSEINDDSYFGLGYDVERWVINSKGEITGVCPAAARVRKNLDGEPIEVRGCVLMSCSLERYRELDQHGDGGGRGQKLVDAMERRMSLKAITDPSRGMHRLNPKYMRVTASPFDNGVINGR